MFNITATLLLTVTSHCGAPPFSLSDTGDIQKMQQFYTREFANWRNLDFSANDSVAMQWAWHRHLLAFTEGPSENENPSPADTMRFIGFVEGRLQVRAPDWWVDVCKNVVHRPNQAIPLLFSKTLRNHLPPVTENGFRVSKNATVYKRGDKVAISSNNIDVVVADLKYDMAAATRPCISVAIKERMLYCASFDWSDVYPVAIYRIDTDSQEIKWSSDALMAGLHFIQSSHDTHWVELLLVGDDLIAFGATQLFLYIEVFDQKTGDRKAVFNTLFSPP